LNNPAVTFIQSQRIRLLAICGSLRASSSNAALLDAVARLAPSGVDLVPCDELPTLPLFNPDLDVDPAPPTVSALRGQIAAADALLVSSPEYAHGVPGALKNALDWLVSGVEIYGKPVSLLNPSPRSLFAHAQLAETFRTMGATLVDAACVSLPIAGRGLDAAAIAADPDLAVSLRGVLDAVVGHLSHR
jgi:chromate reductase, NAD(P)H dehydrogenase (quinone)